MVTGNERFLASTEGYVTLRDAAVKLGRSTARTRQYVTDEDGPLYSAWGKDINGHTWVKTSALDAFKTPERGAKRAGGVSGKTELRHVKAAKRLIQGMAPEGPAKVTTISVMDNVIASLAAKAALEVDDEDETDGGGIEDAFDAGEAQAPAAAQPEAFKDLLGNL